MKKVPLPPIRNASVISTVLVVLVVLVTGCGSSKNVANMQMVNASLNDARSALRQAEQRGAREHAPLELRSANQKLDAAQLAIQQGDTEYAVLLAEEAEVDAELAEITALSTKSENAVKEIRESIRLMREEIKRYQGN